MKPLSKIFRSGLGQKAIDLYLGGVPDPEWRPLFTFPWGEMALPGERGRTQKARAETFEWTEFIRFLKEGK